MDLSTDKETHALAIRSFSEALGLYVDVKREIEEVREALSIEEKARLIARLWHHDQWWGTQPYFIHVECVADTAEGLYASSYKGGTAPDVLISAAWLHDALEDTSATKDFLVAEVGQRVVDIVDAVSDPAADSRKERKRLSYPRIAADRDAVYIKLCDRLVNVRNSLREPRYLKMYQSEHEDFKKALHTKGEYEVIWTEIESHLIATKP